MKKDRHESVDDKLLKDMRSRDSREEKKMRQKEERPKSPSNKSDHSRKRHSKRQDKSARSYKRADQPIPANYNVGIEEEKAPQLLDNSIRENGQAEIKEDNA